MEVILAENSIKTTIDKVQATQEIIIDDGLLKGQIFYAEDLIRMKNGEKSECFGHKKIFDLTFDKTFE